MMSHIDSRSELFSLLSGLIEGGLLPQEFDRLGQLFGNGCHGASNLS